MTYVSISTHSSHVLLYTEIIQYTLHVLFFFGKWRHYIVLDFITKITVSFYVGAVDIAPTCFLPYATVETS